MARSEIKTARYSSLAKDMASEESRRQREPSPEGAPGRVQGAPSGEKTAAPHADAAQSRARKKSALDASKGEGAHAAGAGKGGAKPPAAPGAGTDGSVAAARRARRKKKAARAANLARGAGAGAAKAGAAGARAGGRAVGTGAATLKRASAAAAARPEEAVGAQAGAAASSVRDAAALAGARASAGAGRLTEKGLTAAGKAIGRIGPVRELGLKMRKKRRHKIIRRAAKREAVLANLGLPGTDKGSLGHKIRMALTRRRARRAGALGPLGRLVAGLGKKGAAALVGGIVAPMALLLVVCMAVFGTQTENSAGNRARGKSCELYLQQAEAYCNDDSIGYSQSTRQHNPNMDCSSFVYYCLVDSGYSSTSKLGDYPFDTTSMESALTGIGFTKVDWDGTVDSLQRGDILLNPATHTEIYAGGGQTYGAHRDIDGRDGDSSGKEVCKQGYYSFATEVLRPPSSGGDAGSLTGVAREVYEAMSGYGFTDEAIAAALGNMQQESGLNPAIDSDDGYGTQSLGLVQMTAEERSGFLSWCSANGKDWSDAAAQIEWIFSGEEDCRVGYFANRWAMALVRSGYYRLESGYEDRFGTDCYSSADAFMGADDVDLAVFSWMACYERPGSAISYGDDVSRLNKRLQYANDFLEQIRSGGGEEDLGSASDRARAVVSAAQSTPSPGGGLCAAWVSNVFSNAGIGWWGGNACDQYASWCHSTDRSELKVGMIVATPSSSSGTNAGRIYGHVGIYVGDGKIMHNTGEIRCDDLDWWIGYYCKYHDAAWGWFGGVEL